MSEPSSNESIETTEIFDKLFNPEVVDSFFAPYDDAKDLEIIVFFDRDTPEDTTIKLTNVYPFFTLDDLKIEIYSKLKERDPEDAILYAPPFQFLGIPYDKDGNEIADPETPGDFYDAIDYTFTKKGDPSVLHVKNPYDAFSGKRWDSRFTDSGGNREPDIQNNPRSRSTLEDVFLKPRGGTYPVLHLYLYNKLYKSLPDELQELGELSESEYNGRVFNYFPTVSRKQTGRKLKDAQLKNIEQWVTYHSNFKKILDDTIQPLVEDFSFPKKPKVREANYLQFLWLEKSKEKTLDTIFYQTDVNSRRPYLRFYPADNIPLSKIHVRGVLPIPDLPDPCLLLQWSKEKNPLGRNDYLLAKLKIDPYYEDRTPVYSTLQLAGDGTARVVVEPPRKLEKLDPATDLQFLKENILEGIAGLPFEKSRIDIDESNLTVILDVPPIGPVGKKEIHDRLDLFKPFFQEIVMPTEEAPLLSLRYRAVSNFSQEDSLFLYFTVLSAQKKLPEDLPAEMIERIRKRFSLANDEAVLQKYNDWKIKKDEVDTISTENSIYKRKYNHGIDTSIFFHQSRYIFKIYRVDSYLNLQRILTLLTLMLSAEKGDLALADAETMEAVKKVEKTRGVAVISDSSDESTESREGSAGSTDSALSKTSAVKPKGFIPQTRFKLGEEPSTNSSEDSNSSSESSSEEVPKPKAKPAAPAKPAEEKVEQKFSNNVQKYLIERLQRTDPELFVFSTKQGEKSYVQGCQVNDGKQPVSLDTPAYDRMIEEYRKDVIAGKMEILTYDYKKGFERLRTEKVKFANAQEELNRTFILLKYGTDITNLNYYFCPEFFCIRDNIVIRKDELYGKTFRTESPITRPDLKTQAKEPGRCPFCNGKVIKNPADRAADEFVLHRRPKAESKKDDIKTFINFYSKRIHPNEWIMPCCGKKPTPFSLRDKTPAGILMNDAFKKLDKMTATLEKTVAKMEGREEPDLDVAEKRDPREEIVAPNYQDFLQRLPQQYIIKEDAVFLDVTPQKPQIGLLPTPISDYFLQDNKSLLEKATTLTKIRPNSQGFLRVGVMNLQGRRQESFFSAIAPFLFRNSADEVRELFKTKITPRVFLTANYGNLMMEFFNPSLPEREIPLNEIRDFATTSLEIRGILRRIDQIPYISRIYRSYLNFKGDPDKLDKGKLSFLDDKLQTKEYRQFASILAQPGLITARGIVFLILEVTSQNTVRVVCPPYGFNRSMDNCDIGILLKQGDIWEPVFYYAAKPLEEGQDRPKHTVTLRFQRALRSSKDQPWPKILVQRIEEFQRQCMGPDGAQYTGIARVKEGTNLLSLSKLVKLFVEKDTVHGVVRDTYNHIVAALFKAEPERENSPLIAVPVKDDGILRPELQIYLNWDGFEAAPANVIVDFYKKYKQPLSMFPGYRPKKLVKPTSSGKVEAIQLSSGIFIPATAPSTDEDLALSIVEPQELEWSINKSIMFAFGKEKTVQAFKKIQTDKQLEEMFEHFRLTFSNWFAGDEDGAGASLRKEVDSIINPGTKVFGYQLPLYEKRKRLEILLTPIVMRWVITSDKGPNIIGNLLRVDCTELEEGECKKAGACFWREGRKGKGECLIHAPKVIADTQKKQEIDVPLLFTYKLIEELIRFPPRRDQLLQASNRYVSKLIAIKSAMRIGNTYIVPENSIEWSDLLRMDCKRKLTERPHFFEEMSAATDAPLQIKEDPERFVEPSADLQAVLFGDEEPEDRYRIYTWNRSQIQPSMDLQAILLHWNLAYSDLGIEKDSPDATSMDGWSLDLWKKLVSYLQKGVVFIDLDHDRVNGLRFIDPEVYVLVQEDGETQFLILKQKKEISSIKERLLPESFQEGELAGLYKVKPKKQGF